MLLGPRQTGKRVVAHRMLEQRSGECALSRKEDRGKSSPIESLGGVGLCERGAPTAAKQSGEQPGNEPTPNSRRAARAARRAQGSSPFSIVVNASAQRFPHGLNLFAAKPAFQVAIACSLWWFRQNARPSS